MKIGILTQPLRHNYGGLLQNFALQQTLLKLGYEPKTLNWLWRDPYSVLSWRGKVREFISRLFSTPEYNGVDGIQKFTNTHIPKTIPIRKSSDFAKIAKLENFDAYIVGSDQCWRPKYNFYLYEMFLSFLKSSKSIKRIGYAISFGTDEWEFTKKQENKCRALIRKFDAVSVRESSGVHLCKEHFGVDASYVLDPTLLITKEDYISIVKFDNTPASPGNLFYYILDTSKEIESFINTIASKMVLKPFKVCRTNQEPESRTDNSVSPSVTSWLRAFMDAEMVIVDSFHGMVFSIIFNKPFWVIGNRDRGMSRFESLLKLFGLENRLVSTSSLKTINYKESIDWECVNTKLSLLKEESISFLKRNLRDE